MAANTLTFNQLGTVLSDIVSQASGQKVIAPVDTSSFITVAQMGLQTGYDPLATAISQVLSRTIFSIRPYDARFRSLMVDEQKWGNHVRKLQMVDAGFDEEDNRIELSDGESVDMYVVKKPEVLQTNFYGANVYQKHCTFYRDQLDNAFSSPDEFANFLSMYITNNSNEIEQAHEATSRMTIANFIGGKIATNNGVYHLLTEYNAFTGKSFTRDDIGNPDNLTPFIRWLAARINYLSDLMEERSYLGQINITGKEIQRHTPKRYQKLYMNGYFKRLIDSMAMSTTYNEDYLRFGASEGVNFWQDLNTPEKINITPSYLNADDGTIIKGSAIERDDIIGVLFDEEAMGMTVVNRWSMNTPFNARGGYYNQYWHFTDRYWNDFTEKGLVFVLD